MRDRPTGAELLEIARVTEAHPDTWEDQRLVGLMIANARAIAARDAGAAFEGEDFSRDLATAIRNGTHDDDRALYDKLRADARSRVALSNPKYLERDA